MRTVKRLALPPPRVSSIAETFSSRGDVRPIIALHDEALFGHCCAVGLVSQEMASYRSAVDATPRLPFPSALSVFAKTTCVSQHFHVVYSSTSQVSLLLRWDASSPALEEPNLPRFILDFDMLPPPDTSAFP